MTLVSFSPGAAGLRLSLLVTVLSCLSVDAVERVIFSDDFGSESRGLRERNRVVDAPPEGMGYTTDTPYGYLLKNWLIADEEAEGPRRAFWCIPEDKDGNVAAFARQAARSHNSIAYARAMIPVTARRVVIEFRQWCHDNDTIGFILGASQPSVEHDGVEFGFQRQLPGTDTTVKDIYYKGALGEGKIEGQAKMHQWVEHRIEAEGQTLRWYQNGIKLLEGEVPELTLAGYFGIRQRYERGTRYDDVMQGIRDELEDEEVELKMFYLDGKRHPESKNLKKKASEALRVIQDFKPQVIIVSDDAAVQYLVVPHFKDGPTPVVFCGVNWSCAQYGLPTSHVTGMLEVVPIEQTLQTVKEHFPRARKLWTLSEDSTSERSNRQSLASRYQTWGFTPHFSLVSDFETWKREFITANREADIIYLPTNGAVQGWDSDEARAWVEQHIRKPVVTCDDFMMRYCVFGRTKVAREQGEWAAQTALAILKGKQPDDIPVISNQQTRAYLNPTLAKKINFQLTPTLQKECQTVE